MEAPAIKIYRPRQVYVGHKERKFIKIEDRPEAHGFDLKSINQ